MQSSFVVSIFSFRVANASRELVEIQERKSVSKKNLTPFLKQSNCWVSDGLQAGRKFFENILLPISWQIIIYSGGKLRIAF